MSEKKHTPEESEVEGHGIRYHAPEEPKTEQETEQVKADDRAPDPEGGEDEVKGHASKWG